MEVMHSILCFSLELLGQWNLCSNLNFCTQACTQTSGPQCWGKRGEHLFSLVLFIQHKPFPLIAVMCSDRKNVWWLVSSGQISGFEGNLHWAPSCTSHTSSPVPHVSINRYLKRWKIWFRTSLLLLFTVYCDALACCTELLLNKYLPELMWCSS